MSVTVTKAHEQNEGRSWTVEDGGYSPDDMIGAFEKGKKAGRDEVFSVIKTAGEANLKRARALVEQLFGQLDEVHQLNPLMAGLSQQNAFEFKIIVAIPPKKFASNEALTAIREARKMVRDNEDDTFKVEYMFMPATEELNHQALRADGYKHIYAWREYHEAQPREA